MKLAIFEVLPQDPIGPRLGLVLDDGLVIDMNLAMTIAEAGQHEPRAMALRTKWARDGILGFIRGGQASDDAANRLIDFVQSSQEKGETLKGAKGTNVIHSTNDLRFHAPLPRPGKFIAVGFNFNDHIEENPNKPRARYPMGFIQVPRAITGHEAPIVYPQHTKEVDYEVEIAIVIGKGGRDIPVERAMEHVAGYTIFNDISARDFQRGEMKFGMLFMGKNFDGFAPMGPYLVTADEVPDPDDLTLQTWVNDEREPRQDGNTRDMIFKMSDIISHWSKMTLEPGDIISTGTPSGVATFRKSREDYYLRPGDTVRCVVSHLGELRNTIVADTT